MKYCIEVEIDLGMSHCGGVTSAGKGVVDLSDQEVKTLVELMKSKQTTDAEKLSLDKSHPRLYKKLHDAYSEVACNAEKRHWIMRGFEIEGGVYNLKNTLLYCVKNDLWDCYGDFSEWLYDYLDRLDDEAVCDFYYKHINDGVDLDDIEYDIIDIPEDIKKMVSKK